MHLNQIELQQIVEALASKGVSFTAKCPECGTTGWELQDAPYALMRFNVARKEREAMFDPGYGLIFAVLVCQNCGFSKSYLLNRLGIDPLKWSPDPKHGV